MSQAIQVATETTALARPSDQLSIDDVVARVQKVKEVQRRIMRRDVHFGVIPGTPKPTLLKPGAELLGMTFRLDPQFEITEQVREDSHLTLVVRCSLYHAPTGARMGSGMGSCSTRESKYAWRKGERTCPKCGKATIRKSKDAADGWYCWRKLDGCGATFAEKDPSITGQALGRVPNEDVADQHNTVLKMACKRAHVAAILFVTCASEIFTQDIEDEPRGGQSVASSVMGDGPPEQPDGDEPHPMARLQEQLAKLEELIAKCTTYEEALTILEELGAKSPPKNTKLTREIQEFGPERRILTGAEYRELTKVWARCDRQLTKKLKELAPDVTAHFIEHDAYEPDPSEPHGAKGV